MPKPKKKDSPQEQAARFRADVEKLIGTGELNPTDAEKALDKLVREGASSHHPTDDGGD